jgi:hypothetical protein
MTRCALKRRQRWRRRRVELQWWRGCTLRGNSMPVSFNVAFEFGIFPLFLKQTGGLMSKLRFR